MTDLEQLLERHLTKLTVLYEKELASLREENRLLRESQSELLTSVESLKRDREQYEEDLKSLRKDLKQYVMYVENLVTQLNSGRRN